MLLKAINEIYDEVEEHKEKEILNKAIKTNDKNKIKEGLIETIFSDYYNKCYECKKIYPNRVLNYDNRLEENFCDQCYKKIEEDVNKIKKLCKIFEGYYSLPNFIIEFSFYEETGNIYIVVNGVKFNANLRDYIYQKDSRGISGGEIRIDNMGIDVSLGMRYEEYKRYLFTRYFFSVQEGDKNFFTQKEETIRGVNND